MEPSVPSQPASVQVSEPRKITITKRKLSVILGSLAIFVLMIALGMYFKRGSAPSSVVATVNDEPVYTSYIQKELALYPGTKDGVVKDMLTQKVIDDTITLEAAKQDGLLNDYPDGPALTTTEYLVRTNEVARIKKEINETGNTISGKMVSLWIYNNGYIGPLGFEKGREFAYAKIQPLYDKVARGEMTIEEAGEALRADTTLSQLDPVWEVNALSDFTYYGGKKATFWPEFDEMLWSTKEGAVTPLYLGTGKDATGVMRDELYIFGQVDKKSSDKPYNDYQDWLSQKKKEAQIVYPGGKMSINIRVPVEKVFADDDDNKNSNTDTHGLSVWNVAVTSQTGAPVIGANIEYFNGGNHHGKYATNASGVFSMGPSFNVGCGVNPHAFYVFAPGVAPKLWNANGNSVIPKVYAEDVNGPEWDRPAPPTSCGKKVVKIANFTYEINENITCGPTPTPTPAGPTPKPKLTCNTACTGPRDCEGAKDGCTVCAPATGTTPGASASATMMTCQPPKPACNVTCVRNSDCIGDAARDGCTVCAPNGAGVNVCRPPAPACNVSCVRDSDCTGDAARDGCNRCLPNATGTGSSCQKPPAACNVSCSKDADCATARDGCRVCGSGGKCEAPFDENMCSCDGMDIVLPSGKTTFFPGDDVTFIAYGVVPGKDWKGNAQTAVNAATVSSIRLALFQSSVTNPNNATRIAQSSAITPEVVSATGKVRYKVTWNQRIPSTVPSGTLFRVQATVQCSKKAGVKGAATTGQSSYYADVVNSVRSIKGVKTVLAASDADDQQADEFFPGAKITEKSCNVMKFYFE